MSCTHISTISLLPHPKLSQQVHREECTQCFTNQDAPQGIELCLTCFNGACPQQHAPIHVHRTSHPFTLNIKRLQRQNGRPDDQEPPPKIAKLAIQEEKEETKYKHITTVKCWLCDPVLGLPLPDAITDQKIGALVNASMSSMSSARQSEVKAWEEEIAPCEHTLTLQQIASSPIAESGGQLIDNRETTGLAHCDDCLLTQNLWLCLTCGNLGCGRKQFGGLDGNGHGLGHFEATNHPISVKLGTITPEGDADIYCYQCNDAKVDPEIALHLSNFGINVQNLTKTEKSMTELQIEHNLKYDFSLTTEDGKAFDPIFGPGVTGLSNLGNSCYMASVLQTVFALPAFQTRYHRSITEHAQNCTYPFPAECVECQMRKMADGLLSGQYSVPRRSSPQGQGDGGQQQQLQIKFQEGIRPIGFKTLVAKGHAEFATMKQQDAEEFLGHLIDVLRRDARKQGVHLGSRDDATAVFSFGLEQRLQCGNCSRVRYRVDFADKISVSVPALEKKQMNEETTTDGGGDKKSFESVPLMLCLDSVLLGQEGLEYTCPAGCGNVIGLTQSRFKSFPDVLVVHAKKFQLISWVPTKLEIPVLLPPADELVFGEQYLGKGLQPNEEPLPDDGPPSTAPAVPIFDEDAMMQLEGMGFPRVRCEKATLATGNVGAEAAMEWLFAHMDDPNIDVPIDYSKVGKSAGGPEPSPEQIVMLSDMGFTPSQAKKALRETAGNMERAVEWLFSHPEDMGEDSSSATNANTNTESTPLPPLPELPVRYRLKAFISHKGPSVHSGHYVAHIKVKVNGEGDAQARWVLFNDEKVVHADDESVDALKRLAYLYVFERV
ncbi:hypothetical protein AMATHDRAFT_7506 [Amanita thiersii Skay4041]|uniref:Ubiquitin carboxyl-terminal hydrolase n=1 Tax=Amanita thiersii Skay4041 TaxID=703135 RepID=A0A2A9NGC4_9AGAR|nr:hypothetical protein AMATHDRAFT_7506 [Amanita thiersii Skay4041]